jgi:hypothetical protein
MKKILIVILSATAMMFTSCLKDKNIEDRKYGTDGVEDVPVALFPTKKITTTLEASDKDTTFRIVTVRLAEPNPASEEVKVTLVPNNNLVTSGGFTVAPSSAYSVDNLVVTIPAGQREGYMNITTKTSNLTSATYGFGFTISAVSNPKYTISGNYKDFLAVLPVKNKYDGTYTLTGTLVDVASASLGAKSPTTVQLITTGPNSVVMYNSGTSVSSFKTIFPILSGTSESGYGGFMPVFYFDANENVIKVENNFGQPNPANTRSAGIDPTGVNKFNASTKVLKVKFFMYQPSVIPVGPRTTIDLTLTRTGPR